ncbi:MAG: DUF1569 domain-containing protein [Candidatus Atribacteria bacterium]|nr:MAG: DUF1569 domain-containing protein [Candidatus Atribacteria bacterium]
MARFESLLSQLATAGRIAPHAVFGPLTRSQWCRLAAKHTDHHLRQFGV